MLYVPEHFAERDLPALHAFLDDNGFATLISPDPVDPTVTHLPLLLDREPGGPGPGGPRAELRDLPEIGGGEAQTRGKAAA